MSINQSAQVFGRPLWSPPVRRQVWSRGFGLLGSRTMMMATGKVLLVFFLVSAPAHFWLAARAERIEAALQEVEAGQSDLMDQHIALKAERANLLSPAYMEKMAAQRLALHVPEKKQVFRF